MKYIKFMSLIIVVLLLYGCYEEKDRAIVHINLSGMPIAKEIPQKSFLDKILMFFTKEAYAAHPEYVKKLHLLALKNESLIALRSLDISEVVVKDPQKPYIETAEFEVPEGENIIIVVLAEAIYQGQTGAPIDEILYYGKAEPLTLVAGKEASVNIVAVDMGSIISNGIMTINATGDGVTWSKIPGATGYSIYNEADALLQHGQSTSYIGNNYQYMKIEFDYIGKLSSQITFL